MTFSIATGALYCKNAIEGQDKLLAPVQKGFLIFDIFLVASAAIAASLIITGHLGGVGTLGVKTAYLLVGAGGVLLFVDAAVGIVHLRNKLIRLQKELEQKNQQPGNDSQKDTEIVNLNNELQRVKQELKDARKKKPETTNTEKGIGKEQSEVKHRKSSLEKVKKKDEDELAVLREKIEKAQAMTRIEYTQLQALKQLGNGLNAEISMLKEQKERLKTETLESQQNGKNTIPPKPQTKIVDPQDLLGRTAIGKPCKDNIQAFNEHPEVMAELRDNLDALLDELFDANNTSTHASNHYFKLEKHAPHVLTLRYTDKIRPPKKINKVPRTIINRPNNDTMHFQFSIQAFTAYITGYLYANYENRLLRTGELRSEPGFFIFLKDLENDPWNQDHIVSVDGLAQAIRFETPRGGFKKLSEDPCNPGKSKLVYDLKHE
jgi:hypothetical protein